LSPKSAASTCGVSGTMMMMMSGLLRELSRRARARRAARLDEGRRNTRML
jgi:hypothetical protein